MTAFLDPRSWLATSRREGSDALLYIGKHRTHSTERSTDVDPHWHSCRPELSSLPSQAHGWTARGTGPRGDRVLRNEDPTRARGALLHVPQLPGGEGQERLAFGHSCGCPQGRDSWTGDRSRR